MARTKKANKAKKASKAKLARPAQRKLAGGRREIAGAWEVLPDLINVVDMVYEGRYAGGAAVPGAILLMAGQGAVALKSVETGMPWIPGSAWKQVAPINRAREYCAGGLVATPSGAAAAFVLGGRAANDGTSMDDSGVPEVEWTEGDQWWAEGAGFKFTRLATATVPGVGLFSCGGWFQNQTPSTDCRLVPREQPREGDPRLQPRYRKLDSLPSPRIHHAAVWMPPHHVWVLGGEATDALGKTVLLDEVLVYDLSKEKDPWSKGPRLPGGLSRHGVALDRHGVLWVVGGNADKDPYSRRTYWLEGGKRWRAGPPLRLGRDTHALVSGPDGALYALGGSAAEKYTTPDGIEVPVGCTAERFSY
jgi:hypothetical protein